MVATERVQNTKPLRWLVATDLSEAADEAIRRAHALAKPGDSLAVCHVVPHLQNVSPLFPQNTQSTVFDTSSLLATAAQAVSRRVHELTARADSEFEVFVDQGLDYVEVTRRGQSWNADRVVVGSHGQTALSRMLLGSTAENIVRYAPCPVLIARSGDGPGPVVAATDLSDPSLPALMAGDAEARQRGVRLVVVHALELGMGNMIQGLGVPFGIFPSLLTPEGIQHSKAVAYESLSAMMRNSSIDGEIEIQTGGAVECVVREAEAQKAQLVVVGTHGRTGFSRVALGSIAEKVIRLSPCSVLIVRM